MANQIRYQVGFDIQQNNLNQLKASLQDLQKMKISDIMKINETDAASATSALNKIKEEAGRVEDALKQAFNTKLNTVNIETFNQSLKQSGTSIEQVYQVFKAAGSTGEAAFRSLSSSVLSTNIQLKETHSILDKMATTLANTVKWNAASAAVNGLTRSVEQAWGYVKSLDTSLNDIRIVTGKSADDMANFAVQANNAAKELGKTTTDYTNAALIYAQQGLSDKEIEERAKITLKAANVTGQSTDAVSEQLTAVWNGYKVNAEEAELYVDRLAAVAATTASNLEELSTGMSKVASAAAAMGVGEDQLAAQLSTIISVTKQAPESVGTALRTVYARISDIQAGIDEDGVTLGNYSGKMAELGINVLDAAGNLRDMGEVMEEIGGKWGDLTREQQVYLAQTMAGQRQYNNLLALFDNFEQYNKALATAQGAAGTLQEQQDTYMQGTAAHLKVLRASVEDIYDSFADTDSINGLIDGLSTAATVMANFVDSIGGGNNLLKSLGSIGMMVFSEQIAKGINTTITNLEIGKENARQFDQALQATKDWQGIPGLDQVSQDLLKNREQLLELVKLMTPEQFSGMQTLLNDITELGNQTAALEEKVAPLQKVIDLFSNKSFQETIGNGDVQDQISEKIQQQIEEYQNLAIQIENVQKEQLNLQNTPNLNVGIKLEDARVSAQNYIDKIRELNATGNLDQHQSEVQELEQLFNNLPNAVGDDIEATFSQFNDFFNRLKELFIQSGVDLEGSFEQVVQAWNDSEFTNALEQTTQRTEQATATLETSAQRMTRAFNIETFTKAAGSVASLGMAIQQVQNLGSIWLNEDLSTGERVLQTITNLGMTIGMVVPALTNLNKLFKLLKVSKLEDAAASGAAAAANTVEAGALTATGAAATGASTGIKAFTAALETNPIFAAVAALTALAAILGIVANVSEEARKAAIENDQATIDAENKKQEEIENNRQLISSLKELDGQYENGEITRSDLKSTIQDLIDQYGLEGEAADNLAHSYDNLAEYIKKAREEAAIEGKASAERELAAAQDEVYQTAKNNGGSESISGAYSLSFKPGATTFDEPKVIKEKIMQAGFSGSATLTTSLGEGYTTDDLITLYDTVQGIVDEIQELDDEVLSFSDRNNSEYYTNMIKWLDGMSESVNRYRQAQEDLKKYSTEVTAITAENTGTVDFSSIENANQYLEQRLALIQQIQAELDKNNDKDSDATAMADTYLRDNFRGLYTQFDEYAQAIKKFRDQFNDENGNSLVEGMLGNLDEDHLSALMDLIALHPSVVKDWESLGSAIHYISEQDLSNVGQVAGADLGEAQAAAADKYNIYQSLEDQVSGGKTISSKEMESLEPEVQQFFSMMANGSYKMTGDAKEFYETVNNLKLQGFYDTINQIDTELQKVNDLASQNFNYDELNKPAYNFAKVDSVDYDLAQQQLDYLDAVSEGNTLLEESVKLWQQQINETDLSKEAVDEIAEAIANVGDQTSNLDEKTAELKEKAEEAAHQLHDAMFPTDADIDIDVLESLTETIQDIADKSDELDDFLTEDARAAEDVAESILRFDDAIQDVVKNYDDWMAALSSGSIQQQSEAIDGLRDAYADLLDMDASALPESFLKSAENLDLMKAAIDGDIEAYNTLLENAGKQILIDCGIDTSQFEVDKAFVESKINDINWNDINVKASVEYADFLNGLSDIVNAADMTKQQATDYLASMGVDAEVIEQDTAAEETSEAVEYDATPRKVTGIVSFPGISSGSSENGPVIEADSGYNGNWEYDALDITAKPVRETATKENKSFSLKVTSANKSSGGGFKFSQASNGGGSKGTARRASSGGGKSSGGRGGGSGKKGGSGGSGKKGGSGGSGKGVQPDKSQKDLKKSIEDTRDIYHDINIELDQINRRLDRAQKQQDRLYGKQLLNNLNKQSKILEEHKKKLEEKHELQKQDLSMQQQTLKNLGITFDEYGNISNYMDILLKKQTAMNALVQEYNALIAQYNASTNKDVKKQISESAEAINKKIKEYEDEYKNLEDKIKNYDSLREDMEDLVDEIEEETQKQIEINIKKFRMEIEIRLEMGEAERDWNQFRREVLEHTDIIKDTEFDKIFSNAIRGVRDITSYFNVAGSKGSIQALTEQLINTRAEIEAIDKTGSSAIYGDNKAQAMEDLQDDLNELMDQMEDIQGLIDDIDEAYLDTIDDIEGQFDKQIEDYEYVGDLIEHDIDLLTLLYGDKNYDAMNKYYETLERNNLKQLDSLKRQRNFWKEQWDAAVARGDTQAAKQFEENYKETIKNLNGTVEEAAKNLQNKYINAIDKIFDELDKKISNKKGTDYLNTEWELMNKNADEYLDTINTAFAIQETERKYQKVLDENKSIKNQRALKKLMDEQLSILKNKEKVSQYDIDRAEKLLQVEQARIALEEAQSAKTSMRLKRDSQGNYSYEYVADNGAIDDAQANLAQAQNDLYNFDKERYQSNLDDMLSAWRDFQSDYKDIILDTSLTEQERIEKLSLLREQYGEYINDKTAENLVVRNNLMESAFADLAALYNTDVENYNQMSIDEQNILMGDLVPAWESGIQQMADKVAGEGGFIPVCEEAFNNITDATKAYKNELDDLAQTAGFDLTDVKNSVNDLAYSFEDLITDNEELTNKMYDELDAVQLLRAEVHTLVEEYKAVYDAAKLAVSGIHGFVQAQRGKAAAEAAAANGNKSSGSDNGSGSDSKSGKSGKSTAPSSKTVEGIAGNIWVYGTWGNDPDRHNNMITKFGKEQGDAIYKAVQAKFNSGYGYNGGLEHDWDYYKKFSLSSFRSGGYTGMWAGENGKIGILHQKEMVLNQEDTKNLLNTISVLRSVMSSLGGTMAARLGDIRSGFVNAMDGSGDGIEQNVHIEAMFPNVDSKREIEEAFNDLVNLAAQRAMRRQ